MKPALALTVLLLAGCSGRSEPETPAPPPPQPAANDGTPQTVHSADGVPIRYRVYGSGEPILIFIHSWGGDGTYWDAQIDHFRQRHTVVTLDLAGHGESGITRKRWTMDSYADDVVAVAARVPGDSVVLVGHSMGGAVALQAARRMRNRVIGIVGAETFQSIADPPAPPEVLERRLDRFRSDFQTAMREYVARTLFRSTAEPELVRRIADDMASSPPGVVLGSIRGMNEMNYAAAVADVEVPLIAINSDSGPTDADRIRIHAPTFQLKLMRGVGHFVMIEDPLRFNGLLDDSLAEIARAAHARDRARSR